MEGSCLYIIVSPPCLHRPFVHEGRPSLTRLGVDRRKTSWFTFLECRTRQAAQNLESTSENVYHHSVGAEESTQATVVGK